MRLASNTCTFISLDHTIKRYKSLMDPSDPALYNSLLFYSINIFLEIWYQQFLYEYGRLLFRIQLLLTLLQTKSNSNCRKCQPRICSDIIHFYNKRINRYRPATLESAVVDIIPLVVHAAYTTLVPSRCILSEVWPLFSSRFGLHDYGTIKHLGSTKIS